MELKPIVDALTTLLTPALPFLVKGGESAAAEAGKRFTSAVWDTATAVWGKLHNKVEADPITAGMVEEIAEGDADPDAEAILRRRLKRLLNQDPQLVQELAQLLERPPQVHVQATVEGNGAAAQQGGIAVGAQGEAKVAQRDFYDLRQEIHQYAPQSEEGLSPETLRNHYLSRTLWQSDRVSLSFLETSEQGGRRSQLRLQAVYTALLTRRAREREQGVEWDAEDKRPLSAVEMLNREQRLVLRGGPGSGKSTFVNFVGLCLAGALLGDEHANLALLTAPPPDDEGKDQQEAQPWDHGPLLPVKMILRDFAAQAEQPSSGEPTPSEPLWNFIAEQVGEAFAPHLQQALTERGGLVMFDGLDEVPEQAEQRALVRDAVQAFAHDYRKCRILVTVRSYAYEQDAWRLADFADAELNHLGAGQIHRFVERWYAHAAELGRVDRANVPGRAALLRRVIFARPRLRELAERPLLLTLMAHLHAERNQDLPEKRVLLYEEILQLLLQRWEGRLVRLNEHGEPVIEQESLAEWLRVGAAKVREALEYLAYQVHAAQPEGRGTADITEQDLISTLTGLNPDRQLKPWLLVEHLQDRTGILGNRGGGVYTFPHRSFQEYLAACYLTSDSVEFPAELCRLGRTDPDRWREVVLLAAAKATEGNAAAAWQVAEALCPDAPSRRKPKSDEEWGAQLAAQVLVESANLERIQDWNRRKRDNIQAWLAKRLIVSCILPARERALAGNNLARLGDPRFDPNYAYLPADPLLGFRRVPAGKFLMGSDPETDPDARSEEQPLHSVHLPDYYLARFPVTVAQFRAFVQDSGYPDYDADALTDGDTQPVRFSRWYDAVAYCRWLAERLQGWAQERAAKGFGKDAVARAFWKGLAEGTLGVGLPSEAEWEKAARGTDGRRFPWGNDADPDKANYSDTGLNQPSAVGCFPRGASPYSCEDMSGNVWEWTRSLWGTGWEKPDFGYPYEAGKQREDLEAARNVLRVLRGGSFGLNPEGVRCASRHLDGPGIRYHCGGFRVVVSPFFSGR